MKTVINIILIAIVALCTWHGFRKGLVGGIAGILAIVLALFGANLLSTAYSHQVTPVLHPFVDGFIDSQNTRSKILERMGYGGSDLSLEDILAQDSSLKVDYAYECMRQVGFYEKHAETLADKAVKSANESGVTMTEAVIDTLGDTITYVGGLVLFFLLILILLIAIANIGNLSFRLPMHETADAVGGAVAGCLKGCLYCVLLCWLLGFLGLIIKDALSEAALARFFLSIDFVTGGLL